jgi:hypothetical protein
MQRWKQRHQFLDDNSQPLQITLPRLKKTVDVRNTRAAGGHLPSSIRSNTMPVLFTNYLRGDPSVHRVSLPSRWCIAGRPLRVTAAGLLSHTKSNMQDYR